MIKNLKVYLGTPGWGWKLYGIGYGTTWFLGFSKKNPEDYLTKKRSSVPIERLVENLEFLRTKMNGETGVTRVPHPSLDEAISYLKEHAAIIERLRMAEEDRATARRASIVNEQEAEQLGVKLATVIRSVETVIDDMYLYADDELDASRIGRLAHYWMTTLENAIDYE